MKKFFGAVILFFTLLEFFGYRYYDNLLKAQQDGIVVPSDTKTNTSSGKLSDAVKVLDFKAKLLAISDDHNILAYVDQRNQIYVKNLKTGEQLYSGQETDGDVTYLHWIRSDSLFIGVSNKVSTPVLTLKTFSVSSKKERKIKDFEGVSPTSNFKAITFSQFTNDVYVLIGNDKISKLYHFDTNGNFTVENLGQRFVEDVEMATTKNELFFQDSTNGVRNVLVQDSGENHVVKTGAALLRVIGDTLYYASLDNAGNAVSIYKYENEQSEKINDLKEPISLKNILIQSDGSTVIVGKESYKNEQTGETTKLPFIGEPIVENGSLFVISNSETDLLK